MQIAVLDTNKQPLAPTTPRRARFLLTQGKAAVYRRFPFCLILKEAKENIVTPDLVAKYDPGSNTTGITLLNQTTGVIVFAAELSHRGEQIKADLLSRRQTRNSRRQRKTRYRPPSHKPKKKYLNRLGHRGKKGNGKIPERLERKSASANKTYPKGWLPPSVQSRLTNTTTWDKRLRAIYPIKRRALEDVKFDTQLLENPEICGIEYQQGTLAGYNLREYVLIRDGHKCVYCGAENVPLQLDHIIPKSRNGHNRPSNLCAACQPCNQRKNDQTADEFGFPDLLAQVQKRLAPAAHMNAIRHRLRETFNDLPLETGSGGLTKFNRTQRKLPKTHWLDAACVGASTPPSFTLPEAILTIKAVGYGRRKMCRTDKHGKPVAHRTHARNYDGWQTGDIVQVKTAKGKLRAGDIGRITIRQRPSFQIEGKDIHPKYLTRLHRKDGYSYRAEKQMALAASGVLHPA